MFPTRRYVHERFMSAATLPPAASIQAWSDTLRGFSTFVKLIKHPFRIGSWYVWNATFDPVFSHAATHALVTVGTLGAQWMIFCMKYHSINLIDLLRQNIMPYVGNHTVSNSKNLQVDVSLQAQRRPCKFHFCDIYAILACTQHAHRPMWKTNHGSSLTGLFPAYGAWTQWNRATIWIAGSY